MKKILALGLCILTPGLWAENPEPLTVKKPLHEPNRNQTDPYCGETRIHAEDIISVLFAQTVINEMNRCQMCTLIGLRHQSRADIATLLNNIARPTPSFYVYFGWENRDAGHLSSATLSLRPIMGGFLYTERRLPDYLPQNTNTH